MLPNIKKLGEGLHLGFEFLTQKSNFPSHVRGHNPQALQNTYLLRYLAFPEVR